MQEKVGNPYSRMEKNFFDSLFYYRESKGADERSDLHFCSIVQCFRKRLGSLAEEAVQQFAL